MLALAVNSSVARATVMWPVDPALVLALPMALFRAIAHWIFKDVKKLDRLVYVMKTAAFILNLNKDCKFLNFKK
jgi:hypothetical protein